MGRDAPAAVRATLRERGLHLPEQLRDDLLLLLTELVTNSVRHSGAGAGGRIEVRLIELDDCVRVEVTDPGSGFDPPVRPQPDLSRTGGLGLVLVDRLSRRWGARRTAGGTQVWFELARDRDRCGGEMNPA